MLFKKRSQVPVEERNYSYYYLVLSAVLFLGTAWAVFDEVLVRRPWKEYQREFGDLHVGILQAAHQTALARVDSSRLLELQLQLVEAQKLLGSPDYLQAQERLEYLRPKLMDATREWQFDRSRYDALYYAYKTERNEGREDPDKKRRLDNLEGRIAEYKVQIDDFSEQIAGVVEVTDAIDDQTNRLLVEVGSVLDEPNGIQTKIVAASRSPIEIKQVILNDFENTHFGEVKSRVDRCQTCHLGVQDEIFEDAPQPFKSHPIPELLNIHPPERFGCTPCHGGQGPALTPGDAHGDADPHWEWPILRGEEVYAGCNSCHYNKVVTKYAEPLNKAKMLLAESGCSGCHNIKGFNDLQPIGPELNNLNAKVGPEWLFRWIKNPEDYNRHTRMPNFRFDDEQSEAVTAYLVSVGRETKYRPAYRPGFYRGGNARRGEELARTIGCKGCHVVGDDARIREERGTSYDIAPELTRVGSKVDPDWLFDWLKNPKRYHPKTRMPDLRLTDAEARDLVAFLMTLKDQQPPDPVHLQLDDSQKIARGKSLIREYGCYGCHSIRGMEGQGKVSVTLSEFGRKHIDQFDFGDTKVPHTWDDWVYNKFKNPRVFATDRIVQKMPVFKFTDEEIRLLRILFKSFVGERPLEAFQQPWTSRERNLAQGQRLTQWYNCIQCHQLEDRGGFILATYEDPGLGPPPITGEGAKVQEPWLHAFLQNPTPLRPWLKIRMPTFQLTDEEITTLTKYFLAISGKQLELRDYARFQPDPKMLRPGSRLFKTLQCEQCHQLTAGGPIDPSSLAPDLALAKTRLKPEWVIDWLRDPSKIQEGTRMPTYFYEGISPEPDILDGDAEKQIIALRDHVFSMGKKK
ncbi:MAG: c-type cytochrome [Bacteroidota bacterium]